MTADVQEEYEEWYNTHKRPFRQRLRRKMLKLNMVVHSLGKIPKSKIHDEQSFRQFCKEKGYHYSHQGDYYAIYRYLTDKEKQKILKEGEIEDE